MLLSCQASMRSCAIICAHPGCSFIHGSDRRFYPSLRLAGTTRGDWINVLAHPTGASVAQHRKHSPRMRPLHYVRDRDGISGAAAARQIRAWASATPVAGSIVIMLHWSVQTVPSTKKNIGAYMKKFNNTLEGTDCGDAGLPANSHEIAKPKTILRVVPKIPETSVRNHLSRPEANSTIASHSERGSGPPEPR